jgi:SAM-dependent methyltransferase
MFSIGETNKPTAMTGYGSKQWFENMFSPAQQGFDLWGHQWRASQKFRYLLTLDVIKPLLTGESSQSILDIGCGLGDFTYMAYCVNSQNDLYGMDISQNALTGASKKFPQIEFRCEALPQIAYENDFDGIISLDCICYLDYQNRRDALENIRMHLKSSGWFLFSSPTDDGTRYFSPKQAFELMNQTGFKIHKIIYNHARLYNWIELPFLKIVNLSRIVQEVANKRNGDLTPKKKNLRRLIKFPAAGMILKKTIKISDHIAHRILNSLHIVKLFQWISRIFFKARSTSHIIILAFKDE